jgi:signal peptidase II
MVLAGVVGNLIDRIVFGRVTDFISVGSFAIFNVADASITVGMAVLVLGIWLKERAGRGGAKTRDPEKGNLNVEETKSR